MENTSLNKNQTISIISVNPNKLVCVDMCDIHQLKLKTRVREREISKRTHRINPRKDLRDFILTISEDTSHHQTQDKIEYIIGNILKVNNKSFFKPICTD